MNLFAFASAALLGGSMSAFIFLVKQNHVRNHTFVNLNSVEILSLKLQAVCFLASLPTSGAFLPNPFTKTAKFYLLQSSPSFPLG